MEGFHSPRKESIRDYPFTDVDWNTIAQAAEVESGAAIEAREVICRIYWRAVYRFVRRYGYSPHDAQDCTQEFFLRFIERNSFAAVDSSRGSFESYLFGALKHFLSNARAKASAHKRGGNIQFISLADCHDAEAAAIENMSPELSPDAACDERSTRLLADEATARLKEQSLLAGKARQFELLEPYLLTKGRRGDYQLVGAELGKTQGEVAMAVHRMRKQFKELVQAHLKSFIDHGGNGCASVIALLWILF